MKRLWIASMGIAALAAFLSCAAAHQGSAESELAAGQLDAAVRDVQAALQSNPDDLQLKHLAAQIFTQRGLKYYQNFEMIAADADFRRAVDYDQFYAPAWDYLGLIAFNQHRWADAIDHGHKAAELQGKPDPIHVQQAEQQLVKVRTGGLGPLHHAHAAGSSTPPQGGASY